MTDPLHAHQAEQRAARRWGVWDDHLGTFVTDGHLSEREAWGTLVAEVVSRHPWMLDVRECPPATSGAAAPAAPEAPDEDVECPVCRGDGDCSECGRDCIECDGYTTITRKRMDEIEAEDRRRQKARTEARERHRREAVAAAAAAKDVEVVNG